MFSIFGDVFVVLAASLQLSTSFGNPEGEWARLFTGLGVLILCVNMTKYLEYNLAFYTLILTLRTSFKKIIKYFISTMPSFFGFLLCGVVIFSPYSDNFQDMDTTAATLFALINGDDVHATFNNLNDVYPFAPFARFYLYAFILLFITAVLNLFIFIIEDAYHLAKVLTTPDRDQHGEDSLDHDSLLLWDSLQHMFTVTKLFEILELPDIELQKTKQTQLDPQSQSQSTSDPPDNLLLPDPLDVNQFVPSNQKKKNKKPQGQDQTLPQPDLGSNSVLSPGNANINSLDVSQGSSSSLQQTLSLASSSGSKSVKRQMLILLEKHHAKFMTETKRNLELRQRQFMDELRKDIQTCF